VKVPPGIPPVVMPPWVIESVYVMREEEMMEAKTTMESAEGDDLSAKKSIRDLMQTALLLLRLLLRSQQFLCYEYIIIRLRTNPIYGNCPYLFYICDIIRWTRSISQSIAQVEDCVRTVINKNTEAELWLKMHDSKWFNTHQQC
jgi:hypothetical protein